MDQQLGYIGPPSNDSNSFIGATPPQSELNDHPFNIENLNYNETNLKAFTETSWYANQISRGQVDNNACLQYRNQTMTYPNREYRYQNGFSDRLNMQQVYTPSPSSYNNQSTFIKNEMVPLVSSSTCSYSFPANIKTNDQLMEFHRTTMGIDSSPNNYGYSQYLAQEPPEDYAYTNCYNVPQKQSPQNEMSFKSLVNNDDDFKYGSTILHNNKPETLMNDATYFNHQEVSSYKNDLFSLEDMCGPYNFNIKTKNNPAEKKWFYSDKFDQIYTGPYIKIPILISMNSWVKNSKIIALPLFKDPSLTSDTPVTRCFNCQSTEDESSKHRDFILTVFEEKAKYEIIKNHHCIHFALPCPMIGEKCSHAIFQINCQTSHIGGPRRRLFNIVFNLVINDQVVGRKVLKIKSSSCPKRDMNSDLFPKRKKTPKDESKTKKRKIENVKLNPPKSTAINKVDVHPPAVEILNVPERFLPQIKKFLKLLRHLKTAPSYSSGESDAEIKLIPTVTMKNSTRDLHNPLRLNT